MSKLNDTEFRALIDKIAADFLNELKQKPEIANLSVDTIIKRHLGYPDNPTDSYRQAMMDEYRFKGKVVE